MPSPITSSVGIPIDVGSPSDTSAVPEFSEKLDVPTAPPGTRADRPFSDIGTSEFCSDATSVGSSSFSKDPKVLELLEIWRAPLLGKKTI